MWLCGNGPGVRKSRYGVLRRRDVTDNVTPRAVFISAMAAFLQFFLFTRTTEGRGGRGIRVISVREEKLWPPLVKTAPT